MGQARGFGAVEYRHAGFRRDSQPAGRRVVEACRECDFECVALVWVLLAELDWVALVPLEPAAAREQDDRNDGHDDEHAADDQHGGPGGRAPGRLSTRGAIRAAARICALCPHRAVAGHGTADV